jgi:hypothetical protein
MSEEIKKIGEVAINSTIINPFSRRSIVSLYVTVDQVVLRGKEKWVARGYVDFKEGNTTGRQRFDGESFDDVVLKIKNFINNEL